MEVFGVRFPNEVRPITRIRYVYTIKRGRGYSIGFGFFFSDSERMHSFPDKGTLTSCPRTCTHSCTEPDIAFHRLQLLLNP